MTYLYNIPNNTTSLDQIVVQTISAVPSFAPLLLVFVFFVVFLGGSGLEKARKGNADYPLWSVVASLSTLMTTLIMSVQSGFIRLEWLVIAIVITIFSGVWLFLNRRINEV